MLRLHFFPYFGKHEMKAAEPNARDASVVPIRPATPELTTDVLPPWMGGATQQPADWFALLNLVFSDQPSQAGLQLATFSGAAPSRAPRGDLD